MLTNNKKNVNSFDVFIIFFKNVIICTYTQAIDTYDKKVILASNIVINKILAWRLLLKFICILPQ